MPMTRNLPSVLNRTTTSPLKTALEVYMEYTLQPPVISIGDVNAAAKPFIPGLALTILYCVTTCPFTEESHSSTLWSEGRAKSDPRSSSGSSIDGSVLKNSTPAEKSLIVNPVLGSSSIPPGIEAFMNTPSGPSSETANLILKPPIPENENPPSTPIKNILSSTGVVVSKLSMGFPSASILIIPPIRPASI